MRADLVAMMVEATRRGPNEMVEAWQGPETRAALAALVAKLGRK